MIPISVSSKYRHGLLKVCCFQFLFGERLPCGLSRGTMVGSMRISNLLPQIQAVPPIRRGERWWIFDPPNFQLTPSLLWEVGCWWTSSSGKGGREELGFSNRVLMGWCCLGSWMSCLLLGSFLHHRFWTSCRCRRLSPLSTPVPRLSLLIPLNISC